jgi:branched-chain amino acid transport system substrate-binding protein
MRYRIAKVVCAVLGLALVPSACGNDSSDGGRSGGSGDDIVIGLAGARVGPIANVGEGVGEAIKDWFDMVNANGGIDGRMVKVKEVETKYEVPAALEAFAQFQQSKAALVAVEGTALSDALTPVSAQSKIPILFPGQGNLATVNGEKFPYAFPGGPLYAHQASALVQHEVQERGDGTSFGCVAWEPPPGVEFCNGVKDAAKALGSDFTGTVVVPAAAADVSAQVSAAVAMKPDVLLHATIFGQAVLLLKGLCQEAPDLPVGAWHWAITQNEIKGAGADCMEGKFGASMSTLPSDNPEAVQMLNDYWKKAGKSPNPVLENNSLYGNGLYIATLIEEGIRQSLKIVGSDGEVTGEVMKQALESVTDYSGYGVACPITITAKDHSGNRAVNIYEIHDGGWKQVGHCVTGPPVSDEPNVS